VANVLCGPILVTTTWAAENAYINFMVIFFCPGKHIYCTHFMENILYGIVQHVVNYSVSFFTIYIIIGYYFAYFSI